jgi:hypothetical protein
MQFKNPEILWGLLLLIIPILVHLFQLRRFKKTPFTNVKMLQKVVSESRKSRSLKKWLLLCTRLLLFTALVVAFAQPFFSKKTALLEKETVIYIDNSFSMQVKKGNVSLLESAIQELLKEAPLDQKVNLFTNNRSFRNITLKEIQSDLLTLPYATNQLNLNEVALKANTLFSKKEDTQKNLVLISDFQTKKRASVDSILNIQKHYIKISPSEKNNISIDSLFISKNTGDNLELKVLLSVTGTAEDTPIAVYNNDKLIAKTSAIFDNQKSTYVVFSIPNNKEILGKITLFDKGLEYDNQLYFSINKKEKINVLAIGNDTNYLNRIFTDDEFNFKNTPLKSINYSTIPLQNLIILDELETIPSTLQQAITSFSKNGGNIVIIPNNNLQKLNYNSFLSNYGITLSDKVSSEQEITSINFDHPLYNNVFEKKITNFQYPKTTQFFDFKTKLPNILSYANNNSFLTGKKGFYIFSSPLSGNYSNFKSSPLIVPTFYKMGAESLQQENIYSVLGTKEVIDIAIKLPKDEVLKIANKNSEFIPQQQPFSNKVTLTFDDQPTEDGIYSVSDKTKTLKYISFNYPRTESNLFYIPLEELNATSKNNSITNLFEALEKDNNVNELWKWFVILALLFALIEIGIQKYLK